MISTWPREYLWEVGDAAWWKRLGRRNRAKLWLSAMTAMPAPPVKFHRKQYRTALLRAAATGSFKRSFAPIALCLSYGVPRRLFFWAFVFKRIPLIRSVY